MLHYNYGIYVVRIAKSVRKRFIQLHRPTNKHHFHGLSNLVLSSLTYSTGHSEPHVQLALTSPEAPWDSHMVTRRTWSLLSC